MAESSNQGQTRRQGRKLKPRSAVWNYFTRVIGDDGKEKAECKRCGTQYALHGTTNLKEHIEKGCSGEETAADQEAARPPPQPRPPSGATVDRKPSLNNEDEARRDLARMIVLHGYDPSVVEDDYFRSFVGRLNPGFKVPSREAIEKMCSRIFRDSMRELYRSNKDDPGKLSVAVGRSKTIETGQVVYVTAHFIDGNWNLHREVNNVRMALPVGDHYHIPLRKVPVFSLVDDAVDDILSAVKYGMIMDGNELFMIAGETTGHINHLNLKGFMETEGSVTKIHSATYMDHVLHSIARCLLPDSEFAKNIFHIIKLLQYKLLDEHKDLLTPVGLLDDPWEYDERWYSCYCSLEILNIEDDTTEQLLLALWRMIYGAIKRVSDSSRPTSNLCLQELFKVRDVLKDQLSKAAHAGNYRGFGNKNAADVLREALETVDKAIQDSYLVWSIPLVLDPRYKLRSIQKYFKKAFGLSEAEKYVSEVRRETEELYNSYDDEDSDGTTEEMSVDSSTHSEEALDEQCRSQDNSHAEAANELDDYLQDSLARGSETEDFNILNWWMDHGSVQYPTVARMARDALAMPTCSKLTSNQIAQVKSILRGYHRAAGKGVS